MLHLCALQFVMCEVFEAEHVHCCCVRQARTQGSYTNCIKNSALNMASLKVYTTASYYATRAHVAVCVKRTPRHTPTPQPPNIQQNLREESQTQTRTPA